MKYKQQFSTKPRYRRRQLSFARSMIGKRAKSGGEDDGNSDVPMSSGSTSVSIVESEMSSSTDQGVTVSISYHCLRHIIHDYLAKFRVQYPRCERPQKTYNCLFTFCI